MQYFQMFLREQAIEKDLSHKTSKIKNFHRDLDYQTYALDHSATFHFLLPIKAAKILIFIVFESKKEK